MIKTKLFLNFAAVAILSSCIGLAADTAAPKVESASLGSTKNVHRSGNLYLGGQPSQEDLKLLKERGIERVITLRTPEELEWNEAEEARKEGLEHESIPFRDPEDLTEAVFDRVRRLARDAPQTPTLLHCASANRVGAVWMVHRVLDQGVPVETALQEAEQIGLRTPAYEQKARDYIAEKQQRKSVRPGINDSFLSTELDVDEWIGRFEIESREVYAAREEVVVKTGIEPGDCVADVGAGTGFFTRLFADRVGDEGWVFAIDIAPRFIEHITTQAEDDALTNVTGVLCQEDSITLPPNSIDVAFICDTYHHFEYPPATLASIHRALRPKGTLIVIDFERIPGTSREFILNHVRAGKEVFRQEIEAAGFTLEEEVPVAAFQENYFLRFRKK